jgi:hypothetical protein
VKPSEHIVLGGGAALALAPTLGIGGSLAFWAASVLIDVDHHWDYVYRNGFRDFSPAGMFAYNERMFSQIHRPDFLAMNLFHTAEWFLLVTCVMLWQGSAILLAVLLGMVFHLALDLLRLARHRAVFSRALSLIEYWIRRRILVRRGLDPDRPYADALAAIGRGRRRGGILRRLPQDS